MSALPAGDREPAGSRPAAEWAQIAPAAPQLAATMRRYLGQLATFLAPHSVEVAGIVLRQFACWLLAATSVTAAAGISRDDTWGLQGVAGGPARRGSRPALGQHRRWPATAPNDRKPQGRQAMIAAAAFPRSGGVGLGARVRIVVVAPGHCVRPRRGGGGLFAVARLDGQRGDRGDLGYLQRRSALDFRLFPGHILVAEVRQ